MRFFRNKPLKDKIPIIILSVALLASFPGFALFIFRQFNHYKSELVYQSMLNAKLVGEYSVAPLEFGYEGEASANLAKLESVPEVFYGAIFDDAGVLFADYARKSATPPPDLPPPGIDSKYEFDGAWLHVFRKIKYKDEAIGTIYLKISTRQLDEHLQSAIITAAAIVLGIAIIAYFLAVITQRIISKPVLDLANFAKKISREGDYKERLVYDASDEIGELYDSFNDMLERVRKQDKELRESEKSFRTVMENLPGGLFAHTLDGDIIMVNNMSCQNTGYLREELLKMTVADIDPSSVTRDDREALWHKLKPGEADSVESIHIRKDGSSYPAEIKLNALTLYGEQMILGVAYDITERKKAEDTLRESEERLSVLFEKASDPIYVSSLDGKLIQVNEQARVATGYTEEELLRLTVADVDVNTDTKVKINETLSQLKPGKPITVESNHRRKDGSVFPVEITLAYLETSRQPRIIGVARDITERKIAERELLRKNNELSKHLEKIRQINSELEKAKEKAEESDRLKSAFLANMSHEIRTPMNGVLGFAQILKNPNLENAEKLEYISIIEKSGERLMNTINDLIDISKIEAGQALVRTGEVNLNQLLDDLYSFFKVEAVQKNISLRIDSQAPDDVANILTDKEKLYSILSNLIKNALKFTEQGGVEFGYSIKSGFLRFHVKDSGCGIAPERHEAVFDRFVHADLNITRPYEGSGLGLPISKAYAEMLGGEIWLKSAEGEGSTFFFTIPHNVKEIARAKTDVKFDTQEIDASALTILIAEDDKIAETLLTKILKTNGANLLYARNGEQAVRLCRENPQIDLVMMDVKMPIMDGYEATREIRKFNPDVVIIAQTAYALQGDREKALDAGCDDYISKPIKPEILLNKIEFFFA